MEGTVGSAHVTASSIVDQVQARQLSLQAGLWAQGAQEELPCALRGGSH